MTEDRFISVDAEAEGLGGQPFAVGMALTGPGGEVGTALFRCPIKEPANRWVADNVLPAIEDIEVNCANYQTLLAKFVEQWFRWTAGRPATMVVHVAWPVEARLLTDAFPGQAVWDGPYPVVDVAAVLYAAGHEPTSVDGYLRTHGIDPPPGSPHHPLYDALAAERCLRHLLAVQRRQAAVPAGTAVA